MAIEKELKRKVIMDWSTAFPQLNLYSQNALYRKLGCIVLGIELIKLPKSEEYRPHFVIYPLWKKNAKECLDTPIILREFYNKKRLQFSIPYEKHDYFFKEVLESIREQAPILFDTDVSLKKVIYLIDDYSKMPPLSVAPNSFLQGKMREAKLHISVFSESKDIESEINQINNINWDVNNFRHFGVDVNTWLYDMREKKNHRDLLIEQIEHNLQDKKLSQIQ